MVNFGKDKYRFLCLGLEKEKGVLFYREIVEDFNVNR